MTPQLKQKIIEFCEKNLDTNFDEIAGLFGVSKLEAQSAYMDWLMKPSK